MNDDEMGEINTTLRRSEYDPVDSHHGRRYRDDGGDDEEGCDGSTDETAPSEMADMDGFQDERPLNPGVQSSSNKQNKHSRLRWTHRALPVMGLCLGMLLVGIALDEFMLRKFIQREPNSSNASQQSIPSNETPPCESFVYTGNDEGCYSSESLQLLKQQSSIEKAKNGVVASDQAICSQVGMEVLRDHGGNAVDAAIATTLCLGVVNPASSGLGGGAFMLLNAKKGGGRRNDSTPATDFIDARSQDDQSLSDATHDTVVIDCRETAPSKASQDMFVDLPVDASSFGGLAVAVFGELKCLELAHQRYGTVTWSELVRPAVDLADNGFIVSHHLAKDIRDTFKKMNDRSLSFPSLAKFLTNDETNQMYKESEVIRNPALARTLRRIAEDGSSVLYTGPIADQLVQDVQNAGGIITTHELASYKPTLRSPVSGVTQNGYRLVGVPPPSSGGATVIGAARFLSAYKLPFSANKYDLSVHRMVEALRHAFSIRMSLSDPSYNKDGLNTTTRAVGDLVDDTYMEDLRKATKDDTTLPLSQYGGSKWAQMNDIDAADGSEDIIDAHEGDRRLARRFGYLEDSGTSHFSIIDKFGSAVSMTTSINQIFGSYVFSEETGILLGNTMDDFGTPGRSNHYGLKPSEANFIAPGKKPLSSMSPTLVFRQTEQGERLVLAVGGSGGPKIITSTLQIYLNFCVIGSSLFDSMMRPRIHEQLLYHDSFVTTMEVNPIRFDSTVNDTMTLNVPNRSRTALLNRGHKSLLDIDYPGTIQAAAVDLETGLLSAVSDVRKGGSPAGY
eukprot:CAMPEP_0119557426 /NCGR_PEP_ID=MMETSP1352-20130426/9095_1 /TAXON_ID=265584 /ORGANISM="Stauroneis constricta, Strain CCMP1120" /LENGTH=788 /DNA_ID=CAMNT_0007604529 /DNA_START=65 /DNA_END=2431 /DNA_ORIENTATION=+